MNLDLKSDAHIKKCILALASQFWPEATKCLEWRMKDSEQLTEDYTGGESTFGESEVGFSGGDYFEEKITDSGSD